VLSLIPISDANPTRRFPIITLLLIAANVVMFFVEPDFGGNTQAAAEYFYDNAPIPCQFEDSCPAGVQIGPGEVIEIPDRDFVSLILSMVHSTFLHGGFLHIAGNMLFLWVFGNNIEDFLGPVKYLIFYLLGGIAAAFAHVVTHLDAVVPAVGASGAVAAVMGAYLVMFPRARIRTLFIFFLITLVELSAFVVLGLWFVYQFFIGAQEAAGATQVAWMAHVGGFVYGVVAIFILGGRPHRPQTPFLPWKSRDYR
jgi:membrane associated rhomboid family serine protease